MNTRNNITRLLLGLLMMAVGANAQDLRRASYEQVVDKTGSAITVFSSANPAKLGAPITFTARVVGAAVAAAEGTVVFEAAERDGNNVVTGSASVDSEGNAKWTTSLATGHYNVAARYQGDRNHLGSVAANLAQEVLGPADFTLSVARTVGTVRQGDIWSAAVNVKSLNGFDGLVTLACGELPRKMSCGVNPTEVRPTSAGVETTLSIGTIATTVETAGMAGLVFCAFWLTSERRRRRLLVTAGALLLCAAALACGGGGALRYTQTDGTPKGTYKIMITATSGGITHSEQVTVIVQ